MATKKFANNASTTLAASVSAGATTISVTDGTKFPYLTTGEEFMAILWKSDGTNEIVRVAGHSSGTPNSFTSVTKAQEGTSDLAWSAGDVIELTTTAEALNNFETHNHDSVYVKPKQVQDGDYITAPDTGAVNAYTVTLSPAVTTYNIGQRFSFVPANTNTGASTVDFGAGALAIKTAYGDDVAAGAIRVSAVCLVEYNGTNFTLLSSDVTLNGTQTLTNKTLTSPTISTPTISTPTITGGTQSSPSITTPTLNGSTLNASGTELDVLDGVVAGTASADKAIVLDSSGNISGINSLSASIIDTPLLRVDSVKVFPLVGISSATDGTPYSTTITLPSSTAPTTSNTVAGPSATYNPASASSIIKVRYNVPGRAINGAIVALFEGTTLLDVVMASGFFTVSGEVQLSNSSTASRSFRVYFAQINSGSTVYINTDSVADHGGTLNTDFQFVEYQN